MLVQPQYHGAYQCLRYGAIPIIPSSGAALLLDTYTGAAAAYSLRKLRTAYAGSAIRVRRSSDNAEADIGFTAGGDLDTTALLAHTGTGGSDIGYITKWYDQSGNTRDGEQSTAAYQLRIVDAGAVLTLLSKPSTYSISSNTYIAHAGLPISEASATVFLVTGWSSGVRAGFYGGVNNGTPGLFQTATGEATHLSEPGTAGTFALGASSAGTILAITHKATPLARQDGEDVSNTGGSSASVAGKTITVIGRLGRAGVGGSCYFSEWILYDGAPSSEDTAGIETNMNTYYEVY